MCLAFRQPGIPDRDWSNDELERGDPRKPDKVLVRCKQKEKAEEQELKQIFSWQLDILGWGWI